MLESAGEELAKEMEKRNFEPLAIPYVTNVTAKYVTDIKETKGTSCKTDFFTGTMGRKCENYD